MENLTDLKSWLAHKGFMDELADVNRMTDDEEYAHLVIRGNDTAGMNTSDTLLLTFHWHLTTTPQVRWSEIHNMMLTESLPKPS